MKPFQDWGLSRRGTGQWVWLIFLLLLPLLSLVSAQAGKCGRYRRVCARNATCVDRQCVCNPGLHGAPLVECVHPNEFQCVIKSDPHLKAFGDAKGNLNFPCKYRMTRVQSSLKGAVPGLSFCAFEVFGFNEVINGKYFTSGVEISFAIGDFANQIFRQEDVIKFDVNQAGVQSSTGDVTVWGSGTHSTWKGVEVTCGFDNEESFVIFEVPRCHFRVKFRPFNPSELQGPQSQVPAISIVVGPDTIFGETELGTAILLDALNQNITQESLLPAFTDEVLQDKDQCQDTVDEFTKCPDLDTKVKAVHLCSRILTKRRIAKCLGIQALEAFKGCIRAVCSDKDDGCDLYKDVFDGKNCIAIRKVNKFCKP